MKTISIANKITRVHTTSFTAILPFVMARKAARSKFEKWKDVPYWLEYSAADSPSEDDLKRQPKIPAAQTLNSYLELHEILYGNVVIRGAVCERIPGGVVAIYKLQFGLGGCLWTMLPEDAAKTVPQ